MTQIVPSNPDLFSIKGTSDLPEHPSLKGCRCKCGYVFFPRHQYGCEFCGRTNDEIDVIDLTGKGRLRAFATVHRHNSENIKTPFIVATIILKDGCAIRALLDVTDEEQLTVGQTVYSSLVEIRNDDEGRKIVDLRFKP